MKRLIWAALGAVVLFSGCSSGGRSTQAAAPISVAVSPSSSKGLDEGQSLNVTATVTNDSSDKGVTWTCTFGGAACAAAAFSTSACTVSGTTQTCAATFTAPSSTGAVSISAASVANSTKSASLAFSVSASPSLPAPSSLPASCTAGAAGAAYSCNLGALLSGGTPPFTWSLSGGSLPAGLTLNTSTGVISGTLSSTRQSGGGAVAGRILAASDPTVTIMVCDSATPPVCSSVTFTITVALGITTTSLPSGTAGSAYTATVTAGGGATPYSWTITGLPTGLAFTSGTPSATISGSTCQTGNFTVTATVTDSESTPASASATFTLTIAPTGTLTITTSSPLPNATLGSAYSATITATGGCMPYTWSVAAGSSLPAGLALTSGSPSATISGTPTVTGTYKFTLQVSDSESPQVTVSATFLLTSTESPNVSCPTPVNLTLCGTYVVHLSGFNSSGGPVGLAGDFVADNAGHVATSGAEDINSSTSSTGDQEFTITGGSYAMDASGDGRGVLTLIYSDASSTSYRIALESAASGAPVTGFGPSPIEEFDSSGTLASGEIIGPATPPFVPPPPGFLALPLEGANGSGQRVGLLGEVHLAGSVSGGCDGTTGSFVSVAGENVIINTQGKISNVTFAGSCSVDSDFSTTGRGTATVTVSGGTPFADATLHFVFYQLIVGPPIIFLETDAIGPNQPILSGMASVVAPVTAGITASGVDCSCVFTGQGTTDGTITTGHSAETVIGFSTTASGDTGTLSGIEDQNSGGTITLDAAVSGTYTVDNNSVGTITLTTPAGTSTIHFIIDNNLFGGNSDNTDTLDEGTSVQMGSTHPQLTTTINNAGSHYVLGLGFGDLSATPANVQTVGVVTPTGTTTSGTLPGIVDVMPGMVVGAAASGTYAIDSTTGRGTGTANLTNGASINVVYWSIGFGKFVVLDVKTADPDLVGIRLQ
jgi:Putative Ig domain